MKRISRLTVITTLVSLLPILLGIALYDRLPDVVATHWNIHNQPDGWSSRATAAFGMPATMAAINLIFGIIADISNRPFAKVNPVSLKVAGGRKREEKLSDKVAPGLLSLYRWIIPVMSLIMAPVTLYSALGVSFDMGRIVCSILGVTFIITGNYLPKCRRNGVVGIKIPWTVGSDENWDRTHRFSGFLWIICGGLIIAGGWLNPVIAIAAGVAMLLLPVVYSGILNRKGI